MQIRPSAYIPTSPVSFFLFFLPRGNYSLVKRICFYKGRPAIMYIYMHPTFHTHTLSSLSSLPLHPPSSHLISSSQPQSSQKPPLKKQTHRGFRLRLPTTNPYLNTHRLLPAGAYCKYGQTFFSKPHTCQPSICCRSLFPRFSKTM